jgi:hypothetical protein
MATIARRRRRAPSAVQEALFEVQIRPERRFYRQILQALTRSSFPALDVLRAETTVAKLLGVIWASAPGRDSGPDEAFGLGLVEYARQSPSPTSAALVSVLANLGPVREIRDAADAALDSLVAAGVPVPEWPQLFRGRCWASADVFGDLTTVVCEFGYGPTWPEAVRHGVVVQVDHVAFSAATDASVVSNVEDLIRDLQYGSERAHHDLRQVEPAWAGALLGRAFARTDLIPDVRVTPTFAETRALALARVRALPASPELLPVTAAPDAERRGSVAAEFLASPDAVGLAPHSMALAHLVVDFASERDPDDLARVSPGRWEAFLFDWLPARPVTASSAETAAVVRAWSAWGSRQAGLPQTTRDELARVLDELLEEYVS